jgi:hypothetical protein
VSDAASAGRSPTGRPAVVIFDVNETLSDMGPLADAFERAGLGGAAVEPWFAGVLRDGFALTSVGVNPGFADPPPRRSGSGWPAPACRPARWTAPWTT